MSVKTLADEYAQQSKILTLRADSMVPLISQMKGEDLLILQRKIKLYNDMAEEAQRTAEKLYKIEI